MKVEVRLRIYLLLDFDYVKMLSLDLVWDEFEDTKGAERNRKVRKQTRTWLTKLNERHHRRHNTTLETKTGVTRNLQKLG